MISMRWAWLLAAGAVTAAVAWQVFDRGPATADAGQRQDVILGATLKRDGLAAALDSLEAAAARDSAVLRDAHQHAHQLGRLALAARGDPGVLAQCRPAFSSGCYHGVVESYVQSRGRVDMAELERMCAAAGSADRPGPVTECVHGLGHGVLGALALDLNRTLAHCDELSTSDRRGGCYSGAFMEAVMASLREGDTSAQGDHGHAHAAHDHEPDGGGRLVIDPADPFSPCGTYGDPYAKACWVYQGFLILRTADFDARAALERCGSAPEGRVALCAQSIGFQITGLSQRGDGWIREQCARVPAALGAECAAGAAAALSSMDWSGARVRRFCQASAPPWQSSCYASAARVLGTLMPAVELQRFCDALGAARPTRCGAQPDRRSRSAARRGSTIGRSTINNAGR
jgi:hypothetical protein